MLQYNNITTPRAIPASRAKFFTLSKSYLRVLNGGGAPSSDADGRLTPSAMLFLSKWFLANRVAQTNNLPTEPNNQPPISPSPDSPVSSSETDSLEPSSSTPSSWLRPESDSIASCNAHQHDWSDLQLQYDLVSQTGVLGKRDLLAVALEKVKPTIGSCYDSYWGKQAAWDRYDSLASIMACSDYAKAEDFIRCGYSTFSCQDRLFCPRCCYNRLARRVGDEFGGAYGADKDVYYIVVSLSRDPDETHRLKFKDIGADEFYGLKHRVAVVPPGTESDNYPSADHRGYGVGFGEPHDLMQCRLLWSFFSETIREFTGMGSGKLFSGAVGGPELSVQLEPLRVIPHVNFISWSPGFSVDGARALRKFIRTKMRDSRQIESGLYPSVACHRLRSADDLHRVINYIFKPIDLAGAYVRAAEIVDYMPAALERMHGSLRMVPSVRVGLGMRGSRKDAHPLWWSAKRDTKERPRREVQAASEVRESDEPDSERARRAVR